MGNTTKEVKRRGTITARPVKRVIYSDGAPVTTVYDVTYSFPAGEDEDGKTKWARVRKQGFRSKPEAEAHLRDLEAREAAGTLEAPKKVKAPEMTAVDYVLYVIRMKEELGLVRAVTANNYRLLIARHIAPRFGKRTVAEVQRDDVKAMVAGMQRAKLAPSTIRQAFAVLEGSFGEAVADGLITISPTYKVKLPKVVRTRRREFRVEEIRRLLDEAAEPWSPIFALMAITGLRRSEVLGLQWADLDVEERVLQVRRSLHRVGRELVTTPPKSERSERDLDLDDAALELLASVQVSQAERLLKFGVRPVPATTPIFDNGTGEYRDPDSVSSAWAKLTKRCGVEGFRLHDLRHFVATNLVDSGYDAATVADVMGHHSPSFTLATYVRGRRARRREAASTMTDALGVRGKVTK